MFIDNPFCYSVSQKYAHKNILNHRFKEKETNKKTKNEKTSRQ